MVLLILTMAIIGAALLIVPMVALAIGAIQTGGVVITMGTQSTGVNTFMIIAIARAMDSDRRTAVTACCEIWQR